jgi:hypothetical protein
MLKELESILVNILVNPLEYPDIKEGIVERVLETVNDQLTKYNNLLDDKQINSDDIISQDQLNMDPIFVAQKLFMIKDQLDNNLQDFNKLIEIRKNLIETKNVITNNLSDKSSVNANGEELLNTIEYINMILSEVNIEIDKATKNDPDRDYKLATLYQQDDYRQDDYRQDDDKIIQNIMENDFTFSASITPKCKPKPKSEWDYTYKQWYQDLYKTPHNNEEDIPIDIILRRMSKWKAYINDLKVPTIESILMHDDSYEQLKHNLPMVARDHDEYTSICCSMLVYMRMDNPVIFYGRVLPSPDTDLALDLNISVMVLIWAGLTNINELEALKKHIAGFPCYEDPKYNIELLEKLTLEELINVL